MEKVRNLGIIFNNTLNWPDHTNAKCGKVFSMLQSLWLIQPFTRLCIRVISAKSYVIPTLLYEAEIFCGAVPLKKRKLNTTYNNIVRYVYDIRKFDRIPLYSVLILRMSLDNYFKYKSVIFLHSIINSGKPEYLYEKLIFCRSNRGNRINEICHRRQASDGQFFIRTIRLWNLIPNNLQTINSAVKFKRNSSSI